MASRSKLPLRIASLSRERAGSSSFDQGGFSRMLHTLRACYDVQGTREFGSNLSISSLRDELLAPLDVLVLCTTNPHPHPHPNTLTPMTLTLTLTLTLILTRARSSAPRRDPRSPSRSGRLP